MVTNQRYVVRCGGITFTSNVPGSVTVLYNTAGVLGSAKIFQTGDHPTSAAFGDFDGDGNTDFAVANGERNDVTIFRAQGTTFANAGAFPVLVNPPDIVTGDFNGDGRIDLAVSTFSSSAVSILLNTGGRFDRRMDYEGPYHTVALAVGDVDQSGTLDVVAAGDNGMSMLLNATSAPLQICAPGRPTCDGSVATSCSTDGTAFTGTRQPCAPTQSCVAGACQAQTCKPGELSCNGSGDLVRCATNGLSSRVYDDCQAAEFCTPQSVECIPQICTPGQLFCAADNRAGTCKPDGSGLVGGGTACNPYATQSCASGMCVVSASCTPNTATCIAGNVYVCQASGQGHLLRQTCGATTHCVEGVDACVEDVCTKGKPRCKNDILWTCNADGTGLSLTPHTSCNSIGQICANGACTGSVKEELWPWATTSARSGDYLHATVFRVDTSRTLSELEYIFSVPSTREVHWVVFQSPSENGGFLRTFEKITKVTPAEGFAYHSSGPISVPLVGGFYYALGYFVPSGQSVSYDGSLEVPDNVTSFGTAFGALHKTFNAVSLEGAPSSFQKDMLTMRVTTAAP